MTAQIPDRLTYDGETHELFSNPLEMYFDTIQPRPNFEPLHTACWRGYVAEWLLDGDTLYLEGLNGRADGRDVTLADVFPNREPPIAADWFTGELRAPIGELLNYVHMGYGSEYERELFLTIVAGKLILSEEVDNRRNRLLRSTLHRRPAGRFGDDEWAMLTAMRADIGNPIPALIYADWLDDQQDPRGTYLRVETEARSTELEESAREQVEQKAEALREVIDDPVWYWLTHPVPRRAVIDERAWQRRYRKKSK